MMDEGADYRFETTALTQYLIGPARHMRPEKTHVARWDVPGRVQAPDTGRAGQTRGSQWGVTFSPARSTTTATSMTVTNTLILRDMDFQNTLSDYYLYLTFSILSDSGFSNAAPNGAEFADLHEQSSVLLRMYGTARGDDIGHAVLSAAIEHLPMEGKLTLMRDIIHNGEDLDKLEELGQFFLDSVLKPSTVSSFPSQRREETSNSGLQ